MIIYTVQNMTLDAERALYGAHDCLIKNCTFDGPADGESALKECREILVEDCDFRLRYPFWHVTGANVKNITMTESCRAAFWYDRNVQVYDSRLGGIKAFREMDDCLLSGCDVESKEFGWCCRNLTIRDVTLEKSAFWTVHMVGCRDVLIDGIRIHNNTSCCNVLLSHLHFKFKIHPYTILFILNSNAFHASSPVKEHLRYSLIIWIGFRFKNVRYQ